MAVLTVAAVFLPLLLAPPASAAPRKEIPQYIHVCKQNDPHLEDCVLNSIEKLRSNLIAGMPEMDVPSIEPLVIPELIVAPGGSGGGFKAVGHNVKAFGGGAFHITRLRLKLNETGLLLDAGVTIPQLSFFADYDVDMRLGPLPLRGRGPLTANVSDVSGDLQLRGKLHKRKGKEYLLFDSAEVGLKAGKIRMHLENLFGGDSALNEATNVALNENSAELRPFMLPVAEETLARFILNTGNKISSQFPFDQLVPPQ